MPYLIKDRIQFLAETGQILSSFLDYYTTLANVAKLVVTNIADFCIIDINEKGEMKRVAVRVSNRKKQKIANEFFNFSPDPRNKMAIYEAAKLGRPIIIRQATKSWLRTVSRIPREREVVKNLELNSFIFAPMINRNKLIGVLTIGSWDKNFSYSENDAIFIDEVADRAALAVDNAKLFSEAQEAIETRDEFLSIASHEIRTPLTSLLLNLQITLKKLRSAHRGNIDGNELVKLVEASELQVERLSRLIKDLLDVSVVATGRLVIEPEPMELSTLIREVLAEFDAQLKRMKIQMIFKSSGKIEGNWDKIRLEQVISNLISNAIKYGNRKPVKISVGKGRKNAILTIQDKGIGIRQEDQNRIFEKFKRISDDKGHSGLGVGLYIAKQIVEAHGGEIIIESKIGRGTTFTVELPLSFGEGS